MSKILVTGGLGFIGSNLITKLLEKNYKVLNIDKISYFMNECKKQNVLLVKKKLSIQTFLTLVLELIKIILL